MGNGHSGLNYNDESLSTVSICGLVYGGTIMGVMVLLNMREIFCDAYKVKSQYTRENKKMQELNSIMRDLLEVEYNQESLLFLLEAAEAICSDKEQKEAGFIANGAKYYLSALQDELKMVINRLDLYIAKNVKKR